jgi:hypothetical protein
MTETLTVERGTLCKEDGTPVGTSEDDAAYRAAYRALFVRLGRWPPDGRYEFDGKNMHFIGGLTR